jgi:hypothetical protein
LEENKLKSKQLLLNLLNEFNKASLGGVHNLNSALDSFLTTLKKDIIDEIVSQSESKPDAHPEEKKPTKKQS